MTGLLRRRCPSLGMALAGAFLIGLGANVAGAQTSDPKPARTAPASAQRTADPTFAADVTAGEALLRARQYEQAMDRFEAALRVSPEDASAHQGEVRAATTWALDEIHAQRPEHAMEILERGIQQLPKEPELLQDFGIEATALGQFAIAEQALQAADKLRPHDPKTVYGLARLELERQQMPEAERDLKAYLALRPKDATAYYGLGHLYAMQQHDDLARAAFEQSLELQPNQTESYYQLGQLELQAHQDEQAGKNFGEVLTRAPSHAGALTGLGQVALRAKDYARAEQLLAAAEKADPNYATPHYFRGLALVKLGRKDEAEEEMRKGDSRPHVSSPQSGGQSGSEDVTKPSLPGGGLR